MKKVFGFIIAIILLFALSLPAYAATSDVSLAWDASIDESMLIEGGGYKVYWGTAPGQYTGSAAVGMKYTHTITGLADGTWYFAATTYTASGLESVKSNEVSALLKTVIYPPRGTRVTTVTIRNSDGLK